MAYTAIDTLVDRREILDWLLDQGVDINKPTKRSRGGLNIAQDKFDRTLRATGDIKLFDHLVARGADPSRSIALHHSTRCADPKMTKAMMSHLVKKYHFDINANENSGGERYFVHGNLELGPPLHCAIVF